ncbi:MAG TPA: DUF4160 domain-containing protein [Candidatus Ozemobacteraceae bacterium]|nr:DUF4160 domain-containing protein [Candidatus Ozemobacteraceae bacterium]
MPIVSMFYGIVIRFYFFDTQQHHQPHFHAEYAGHKAVFSIPDGAILAGNLPVNKRKLVEAWIEIHREDLLADWNLASQGAPPVPIEPLK